MTRTLDTSPLTAPVTREEVRDWRESARRSGLVGATSAGAVVSVVVGVVAIVLFVVVGGGIFTTLLSVTGSGVGPFHLVAVVAVVALVGAVVAVLRRALGGGGRWERWMRLDRFARTNGLRFSATDADPRYPGAIFQHGSSRAAYDHLTSADGRFLDLGNYRYTTGSGDDKRTHTWGFLAFNLDRRLPHMVLDSRANNGLFGASNLPASFTRQQILSLEGDFDRYFTLYCPREYERDALYVFTPDLMALLIDEAAPFDVEIVDDWMFVYSAAPFDMTSPALHERLFRIVDLVGAKALRQTQRYVDERVGDFAANTVAPAGRRLTRRAPVAGILLVVGFAIFWLLPQFVDGGLFGLLGGFLGR